MVFKGGSSKWQTLKELPLIKASVSSSPIERPSLDACWMLGGLGWSRGRWAGLGRKGWWVGMGVVVS